MKTKFNRLCLLLVASLVFFSFLMINMERNENGNWGVATASASGGENDGGSGGKKYHINNPQPCRGTETRHCDIEFWIPGYGACKIGFDYTVEFAGTENYCTFTGNAQAYCDFHTCKRN